MEEKMDFNDVEMSLTEHSNHSEREVSVTKNDDHLLVKTERTFDSNANETELTDPIINKKDEEDVKVAIKLSTIEEYGTNNRKPKDFILFAGVIEAFKYIFSFVLLAFCIAMVMGCIFTRQSAAAHYNIHPIAAAFLFWFLICWLAMIEGGQGCIVGLQPIDPEKYSHSHQKTHENVELVRIGDNMDRFIIGRQFLVVLVIFLINACGSASPGADPFGLPKIWNDIFLENGIAMMMTTIVIGQLTSQVNAAVCMLDFINNYLMLFTTYLSLGVEYSGLLHSVYLVQIGFSKITGMTIESNEPPRNAFMQCFFWMQVMASTTLLGYCLAVTLQALIDGNSGMWDGVPSWASMIIFFVLMCFAGLMDGMQIAAFALLNIPEEELRHHPVAYTNCQLMFSGQNLQSFLIGRQVFVAALIFIVARIAAISGPDGYTIFGASDYIQGFYNTGLLGSIVLTNFGSLMWRIVASNVPVAFMSNPVVYVIIRVCLLFEGTGICSASWGLARIHKAIAGYKPDGFYLEKEEEEEEGGTVEP
eukprot:CAMPEP_0203666140 /NCGR_PEP_ID=MMETSP0090-20130426/3220_1 /ASSEMBLY_ACC=CAM_ASM_001088 /TAXON_ID=426623 /ORGANISM="Chaetoceros affinis, Strain CCMP159" /LENGTH=531 /DNA_ID=CAMNT_0050529927 /DNA_START=182 /DNA_END=1777 /DNA_ORIENTATION=+